MEARLVTVARAAELLGVGERKVWQLLRGAELPSVLIDRSRRIDVRDLETYIRRRKGFDLRDLGIEVPNESWEFDLRDLGIEVSNES